MTAIPPIASLWIGDALSYVEIVVLKSFLACGHDVTLFVRGNVKNVPDGVSVRDADQISAPDFDFSGLTQRFAGGVYSDVFRLDLIAQTDFIWADLDAYCVKPLLPVEGYLVGSTRQSVPKPNNGVLRLPKASEALGLMRTFLHDPNPIPWWFPEHRTTHLKRQKRRGVRHGIETFAWSLSGPLLLNKALHRTGEIRHVLPRDVLYPVSHETCTSLLDPSVDPSVFETPATRSVHLFGASKLHLVAEFSGLPPQGSYIARICSRHEVNPSDFPISVGDGAKDLVADAAYDGAILAAGRGE
jgi:hypothetical protein